MNLMLTMQTYTDPPYSLTARPQIPRPSAFLRCASCCARKSSQAILGLAFGPSCLTPFYKGGRLSVQPLITPFEKGDERQRGGIWPRYRAELINSKNNDALH